MRISIIETSIASSIGKKGGKNIVLKEEKTSSSRRIFSQLDFLYNSSCADPARPDCCQIGKCKEVSEIALPEKSGESHASKIGGYLSILSE